MKGIRALIREMASEEDVIKVVGPTFDMAALFSNETYVIDLINELSAILGTGTPGTTTDIRGRIITPAIQGAYNIIITISAPREIGGVLAEEISTQTKTVFKGEQAPSGGPKRKTERLSGTVGRPDAFGKKVIERIISDLVYTKVRNPARAVSLDDLKGGAFDPTMSRIWQTGNSLGRPLPVDDDEIPEADPGLEGPE